MRLSLARAEEAIVRTHVDNALMFVDTLAEEMPFDRAIDTYVRVMGVSEPLASTVATRALVALGQDLTPARRRGRETEPVTGGDEDGRPRLRLDDADSRQRTVRRA